jgi:phosphomevalonate kinase
MQGPRILPAIWPEGLEVALLWSGRPADTATRLERLSRARRGRESAITALVAAAREVHARWTDGSAAVLASLGAYTKALLAFSRACDLGVFDAGHGELTEEAPGRGLVYKPCGAGGGDIGAVFGREIAAVAEFARWAETRGFERLRVAPHADGVTRKTGP